MATLATACGTVLVTGAVSPHHLMPPQVTLTPQPNVAAHLFKMWRAPIMP